MPTWEHCRQNLEHSGVLCHDERRSPRGYGVASQYDFWEEGRIIKNCLNHFLPFPRSTSLPRGSWRVCSQLYVFSPWLSPLVVWALLITESEDWPISGWYCSGAWSSWIGVFCSWSLAWRPTREPDGWRCRCFGSREPPTEHNSRSPPTTQLPSLVTLSSTYHMQAHISVTIMVHTDVYDLYVYSSQWWMALSWQARPACIVVSSYNVMNWR